MNKIVLALMAGMFFLQSCLDDSGNYSYSDLIPIEVDSTNIASSYRVTQWDYLVIDPAVKQGTDDSNLSYEWRIFQTSGMPNTETGETEVFYDLENMSGLTCDDNGLMYLMTETPRTGSDITEADQTGYVFNPQTGDLVTCRDYVLREFGLTVPDIQIVRVASNGNILARTFLNDNGTMRAVQCLIMP